MARTNPYSNLKGRETSLAGLDEEERKLVERLKRRAKSHPHWPDFANYWFKAVAEFYDSRGIPRSESRKTAVFRIAQDLDSRIMVAAGLARIPDYRDELEEVIHQRFKTQRAFCQATGLSEDMLSHVMARRKHIAIDTLSEALAKIGYAIHIVPQGKSTTVD